MSLWTHIAHGLLAFLWAQAARRLLGPRDPALAVRAMAGVLLLPPLVAIAQLALAPRGWWPLSTQAAWLEVRGWGWPLWALAAGTGLLFLAQELWPLIGRDRAWQGAARARDARLDAAWAQVAALHPKAAQLSAWVLETPTPVAALAGLTSPRIVVSRCLLDALDDRQLQALLAHELAHALRGGNRWLALLWLARAVQPLSPAALVAFRLLVEDEEAACDAAGAALTGRPADLASVLLVVERLRLDLHALPHEERPEDTRHLLIRQRVRRLLDGPGRRPHPLAEAGSAALLAALLLGIT